MWPVAAAHQTCVADSVVRGAEQTVAQQRRAAFLEKNGWLANLGSMTSTQVIEYQIAIPAGAFRIAAASKAATPRICDAESNI